VSLQIEIRILIKRYSPSRLGGMLLSV